MDEREKEYVRWKKSEGYVKDMHQAKIASLILILVAIACLAIVWLVT